MLESIHHELVDDEAKRHCDGQGHPNRLQNIDRDADPLTRNPVHPSY